MRKSQTAFKGAVVVALLLALAAPAVAQETGSAPEALEPAREVPIEGTVVGQHWINPAAPGCDEGTSWRFYSSGTGQISDIGEVDYFLTQCTLFDPEGLSATSGDGITTFTSADGDMLVIAQVGDSELFVDEAGAFTGWILEGTWDVVGGTGRYETASGAGVLENTGDIPGDATFNLKGGIAYETSGPSE